VRTASFSYECPVTLPEAMQSLGSEGAVALAGGQALVPAMKLKQTAPSRVVDLNRLPDLDRIEATAGGLDIGAMVRVRDLASSSLVRELAPALWTAASLLGDVQVRNRATIGGNVCFADPRANLSPALISLGAQLTVQSRAGEFSMLVDDVFAGFRRNSLQPGQLVVAVHVPAPGPLTFGTYRELSRQQGGVPIVNVAVTLAGDPVTYAGVGVGGLAMTPLRAAAVENELIGAPLGSVPAEAVAALLTRAGSTPFEDLHGPAAYRLQVARVLLRRALEDLQGVDGG
jgi:carbon-monoxide dehydrogenase medium subunit